MHIAYPEIQHIHLKRDRAEQGLEPVEIAMLQVRYRANYLSIYITYRPVVQPGCESTGRVGAVAE